MASTVEDRLSYLLEAVSSLRHVSIYGLVRETFIIQTRTSGSSQNVVFGQPFRV